MAKKVWNVGIVGPGWVAGAYLGAFRKRDDVRVTHIVGRTVRRAREFAEAQGIDCAAHDDMRKMAADRSVDIVGVFTPHHLHAGQVILAAKARKHVIIEKPVCLSLGDLRAMRAAVRAAKVKTIVGYVLRWNPLLLMMRKNIVEGNLGDLVFAEADYLHGLVGKEYTKAWHLRKRTAGTAFLLGGCHAVDAIRFVTGREVVEVSSYSTSRTKELDYPSTEIALLKFADGAIGKVSVCLECNMPYVFNTEVYGTKGSFRNNQLAGDMLKGQTTFATIPTIMPDSPDVSHHPFDGEVGHFLECLDRGKRPMPDLEDAARTTEICLAAALSAKRGRPVRLPLR